ncbi:MAG: hypothetical protein PHQ75_11840, partial [Thermoguttaceae bacterium]|nr:hypothetical protein [Thermoguttaceae bacterium]
MTDMLNRLSVFSEWTLRLDRLDSFGETSIVMAMFVFLAIAVVYFYAAVKREIPKRHRVFLLVCRLLTVLTLFVICMQPKIIQWHDQSRVVMLCDTSKSMSITGNESQGDETAVSKTRLQRIRDFSGVATGDHESVPNSAIVHELICNTIGESLGNAIAIAPGEDWQSRLRDWLSELRAEGKESRLSEQLCDVIAREKNHSLAGVVLMTDGCNNIGMGNETLLKRLKTCPCPVHVVAVGKQAPAFEFGIKILRAPSRNRLQSEIPVSLELGSLGELDEKGHGTECAVDLYMIAQDTSSQDVGSEVPVIEPGTKPVATLSFHMSNTGRLFASPSEALSASTGNRQSEPRESLLKIQTHVKATSCGRFVLVAQLRHPRQAVTHEGKSFMPIEVFEKKDKILLIAGGPLRDFPFFESRLKRSSDVSTEVYLSFA